MDQKEEDRATLITVMDRFNKWRYPQAAEMKSRLEKGETLTERDVQFLHRVFEAAQVVLPILERNPEFHELASKAINLYSEITTLALDNEQLNEIKDRSR